jgi:hypothetical protein
MNELEKLGKKYGTDKIGKHNYLPIYYNLFKDKRDEVKKVVEIGIGEGASMKMWWSFFPKATIFGVDIDILRVSELFGRMSLIECDQSSQDDLINLMNDTGPDIDLFIDDGSHKPEDQIFTCEQIIPGLNKGATYIIEDVADNRVERTIRVFAHNHNCYVEDKRVGERYDDRLIIIKKQ